MSWRAESARIPGGECFGVHGSHAIGIRRWISLLYPRSREARQI